MAEFIDKVLEVKDLTVSFKTPGGMVRAVREVNFDLTRNETLCIVGESGSGKSVTSRAILGILAGNAVVDKGEILYRGENLIAIEEQDFHRIRGTKIAMIFQDPLSSLNPIMKVGKQITEAILLHRNRIKKLYESKIENEFIELRKLRYKFRFNKQSLNADFSKQYKSIKNSNSKMVFHLKKEELNSEFVLQMEKAKTLFKGEALILEKQRLKEEYLKKVSNAQNDYKNRPSDEKKIIKDKIDGISKKYIDSLASVVSEYKRVRPSLESALKAAELKAKADIKDYIDAAKAERDNTISSAQQRLASAKQSNNPVSIKEIEAEISAARTKFVRTLKITKKEAIEKVLATMKEVGIPEPEKRFYQYPFQFSGGMRQRIVIAIALATDPEILICDEPTTALDVTIQSQILELINRIKRERHISIIFITHNLGVVANMADRIGVMYAGKIVEYGTTNEIFYNPKHPYTWALLSSMPDLESRGKLDAIPGTPPNMLFPPRGDAFAARNKFAMQIDYELQPPMFKVSETHYAATWLLHENAPEFTPPAIVGKLAKKKEAYDRGTNA
jgi:oligopeptide transport system ATP-binding protein